MKKQKEEVVDFTTRIQKSKSEELQKFARRDKRSVSALLIDAIDAYIEAFRDECDPPVKCVRFS
jgi:predicted HicB family RNase H-like nuclease